MREVVGHALDALPPNQREVMRLRDVEGWSSDEVCNVLDVSETNQRVLLHRARAKVRAALELYLGRQGVASAMTTDLLTCEEFVELVTEYLEGALSPEDHRRFEEHLALCDGCTIYLEQIRQTIATAGVLREESLEPEAQEHLLEVFRNWRRQA